MNQQTTTAALAATANRQPLKKRVFGEHPIGYAFVGPYFLFWLALFAFPLVFAVYIAFHDYFFAAPGAVVERPFVGFENFATVLADPVAQRAALNVVIFVVINVPLTVLLGWFSPRR